MAPWSGIKVTVLLWAPHGCPCPPCPASPLSMWGAVTPAQGKGWSLWSVQEVRDPEPWPLPRYMRQMMRERLAGLLLLSLTEQINPLGGIQARADPLCSP